MVKPVLLADIGSTYTKVLVVDLDQPAVICSEVGLTTAETDISIGLNCAIAGVTAKTGLSPEDCQVRLACSSAAGGLKMVAVGLVPELTAEAARLASLGAGARVIKTYSYQLNRSDIHAIENMDCDIILLAGGTDGGDEETVVHNAKRLAASNLAIPVVVACNRDAVDQVEQYLSASGKQVWVTDNVLPSLRKLNIDPARQTIREIFMKRIVKGKGFEKIQDWFGTILMPTPAAVLEAAKLLSEGTGDMVGLGDLLVVDIGGATTDVHSVASGNPTTINAVQRGLPEPKVKRTVEGDLGLRVSALPLLEAAGIEWIMKTANGSEQDVRLKIKRLSEQVEYVPASSDDASLDLALAKAAAKIAVERHVGRLERLMTPSGTLYTQYGKDLSQVPCVVGTGGIFAHTPTPIPIMKEVCMDPSRADLLKPVHPEFLVDRQYIMWGMGLLSSLNPAAAFEILSREMKKLGRTDNIDKS